MATRKQSRRGKPTKSVNAQVLPVVELKLDEPFEMRWGRKLHLLILVGLVVLFWSSTNSWPVVAVVNYRPIWAWDLNRDMYNQIGSQILDGMVTRALIEDEIAAKKVQVSQSEVDSRIDKIKSQFKSEEEFNQTLMDQGYTLDQVKKEIGMQMGLEKLVEPSTDSAKFQESVYGLVQKLRTQAKVWIPK